MSSWSAGGCVALAYEPTVFPGRSKLGKRHDGHIAVWLPVPSGFQTALIESEPGTYFKPPYVGVRGWVGIDLNRISDEDLSFHIQVAWELVAPKRLVSRAKAGAEAVKSPRKSGSR